VSYERQLKSFSRPANKIPMNIPHSITARQNFSVSMTPMIDVVFLLLIFFVCTASFQLPESILPTPISQGGIAAILPPKLEEVELERILIELAQKNDCTEIAVNGQHCDSFDRLAELLVALASVDSTLPVILDIEGETPLGAAIEVVDRCRLAGFAKIQFAAKIVP